MTSTLTRWREKLRLPSNSSRGMTLIEIIIVVALLATLMAILVSNLAQKSDQAKEDQARIGMAGLGQTLQLYKVHNGKFPTTDQGLKALLEAPADAKRWRGPYTEADKLVDPFTNNYGYESDGTSFKISCTASDGKKVITYPEDDSSKAPDAAEGAK